MAVSLQLFPILVKGVRFIERVYQFKFSCLECCLITMYFVFPEFNDNLFAQNQLKSLLIPISAFLYNNLTS